MIPEVYVDGFGQRVLVHPKEICQPPSCVVHNPSDHPLRQYPTFWDDDRKLMYRVIGEIVAIIDPDELDYQMRRLAENAVSLFEVST